jgi:hypothetical protein
MNTPSALSTTNSNGLTCEQASVRFKDAIENNRGKGKSPAEAHNQALNYARSSIAKRITDPGQRTQFDQFLAEEAKKYAGTAFVYTLADAVKMVNGKVPVKMMVDHLLGLERKWNPSDREAIERELCVSLTSANRMRYAADGKLDLQTIERIEEEAKTYVVRTLRRIVAERKQAEAEAKQASTGTDAKPQSAGGNSRPVPRYVAHAANAVAPKPPELKATPPKGDEAEVIRLRDKIARITKWGYTTDRAALVAELASLNAELATVRARINKRIADRKAEKAARKERERQNNSGDPTKKAKQAAAAKPEDPKKAARKAKQAAKQAAKNGRH